MGLMLVFCIWDIIHSSCLRQRRALNIPLITREIDNYDIIHGGGNASSFVLWTYEKPSEIRIDI